MKFQPQPSAKNILNYIFLEEGLGPFTAFSLAIKDSDTSHNETILNAIIGNLVKYTASGKIEPYLAHRFNVSSDRLRWSYELRPNLTCDDGTPITATKYARQLEKQIRLTTGENPPIDFEHLLGFQEFMEKKAEHIAGITTTDNTIIFTFSKAPEDLNELLRMPYFGYWSDSNLSDNGWSKGMPFVSSGPYSLASESDPLSIVVRKRKDWFSVSSASPQTIRFYSSSEVLLEKQFVDNETFILEGLTVTAVSSKFIENLTKIDGAPTLVQNLVLNPFMSGPFNSIANRSILRDAIRKIQSDESIFTSKYFYRNLQSPVHEKKIRKIENHTTPISFKIATRAIDNFRSKKLIEILQAVPFVTSGQWQYEILTLPKISSEAWWRDVVSFKTLDSRFVWVAAGARPRNFIVKMMFCTDLGVRYPDPSGRICKLVREQEERGGPIGDEYIAEFNQALYDDAAVIPLMHFGTRWYLSPQIDKDSFPPTVESPLFEKIRLNL